MCTLQSNVYFSCVSLQGLNAQKDEVNNTQADHVIEHKVQ